MASSCFTEIKNLLEDHGGLSLNKLKAASENINLKDKKPVIDVALRSRMLRLLASHSIDEVKALLKMGVAAALANICSAPTPFLLFSDVFNTKPISVCQELFSFMEETITTLKDVPLFGSGRNTLLRMCNDLLRRLSKSQNTVFCGQIQLFLSRLFPLDEKSGLNLMSNFNLDKETPYNKNPDPSAFKHQTSNESANDELEEGETTDNPRPTEVNANLYVKFWSIQEFFRTPTSCFDRKKWAHFQNSADTVLEIFSSIKLLCADDNEPQYETNGTKFSKYLTSERLLDLQLMDASFRRYILVQLLLVFQYLITPTKFKTADQVLSDEQMDWVNRKRESVLRLLSNGKSLDNSSSTFASVVERILEREEFWNRWKNEGCPSFVRHVEKSPLTPRKRRMNPLVDRAGNKIYRFGNRELDKLWNVCPDNLAACRDERRLFRPDLRSYFQNAILELDPTEKVEEEYKSVNKEEWSWRALRCLSRRCPHFYINWNPPGRPIKDYLTVILTEKMQSEEDRKSGSSMNNSSSSSHSVKREQESGRSEAPAPKQPRVDGRSPTTTGESITGQPRSRGSRNPKSTPTDSQTAVKSAKKTQLAARVLTRSRHASDTQNDAVEFPSGDEEVSDRDIDNELASKSDADSTLIEEKDVNDSELSEANG
ncbi:unnamed protein product [Calicophoron daubneyi]|uniref:THO complex subunit 1 n=1 Tax=Calicophoron daubneyi TaxID=300641 RepID=A0AAV2T8U4_CALDB